jgi:amino acid transporter
VWLLTLLNCVSLRAVGYIQVVTVILKLLPLLLVIAIAAFALVRAGDCAIAAALSARTAELGFRQRGGGAHLVGDARHRSRGLGEPQCA